MHLNLSIDPLFITPSYLLYVILVRFKIIAVESCKNIRYNEHVQTIKIRCTTRGAEKVG